ncbi:MAG TPA: LacI family DNA-binding transcriptional regulator [Kribbellaceae bacterium]|nr:LacI family DNA-binding transcriptional regulator [Kribbellaceae bacterium]
MVSVKDVARAAGVSLGTVSNVLNRPDRVSETTRQRVEHAMRQLGFVRNEAARHLRAGRSKTIGFVVLDATNPFFSDVARGAEEAAAREDYVLFLCNTDNREDRERQYLTRLQEQRVAGILVTPFDADDPALRRLTARGIPVVCVDRMPAQDDLCAVAVDNQLGGRLAAEHLLDLGHETIAFVGGPHSIGQVRERWLGARAAMLAAGLDESRLIRVDTEAPSVAGGRHAGERLAGLPASRRPTAAFCANDLLALGLLQQSVALGIRVPDDLAIVGYDDIEFAAAAAVPLTSIRQPRRELGLTAARLLLDEADNPQHRHEQVLFTPELVARASTRRSAAA